MARSFLLLLSLLFSVVACETNHGSASDPASTYRLSKEQLEAAENRARNGDMDAAFALASHYGPNATGGERWLHWLDVAISLGHPVAMANKAAYLAQSGASEECGQAKDLYADAIKAATSEEQRLAFSEALASMEDDGFPCVAGRVE